MISHPSTRSKDLSQSVRRVEGGERGATRKGFDRPIRQLPAAEDSQRAQLSERGYGFDSFVSEFFAVSDVERGEGGAASGQGLN